MLKKIAVWLVKTSIYALILALMFSTVSLEFSKVASGTLSDIFSYASNDAKNDIVNALMKSCPSGIEGRENSYRRIEELCSSYSSGKITKNEFFEGFAETSFTMTDFKNPKMGVLSKYEKVVEAINENIILAAALIIILCLVLYLLIKDMKIFLIALAGIFFSIGLFVMIPYSAIKIYQKTVGINTTPLLKTMLGSAAQPQPSEIIDIMMLIILRTYSELLILLGTLSLAIGIIGKFIKRAVKKRILPEKKEKIVEIKSKK